MLISRPTILSSKIVLHCVSLLSGTGDERVDLTGLQLVIISARYVGEPLVSTRRSLMALQHIWLI